MKISAKLQTIQKILGLGQEKLAQKLGVSFATLNSWINDKSRPREAALKKIEDLYLEVTGEKNIPDVVLEAKKFILDSQINLPSRRGSEFRLPLERILKNSDIYDEFMLALTYHSNAIEGSTLTENETAAILFDNVALPDKHFIEQLEAKNHQSALQYLFRYLSDSRNKLNEELVLRLHAILMNGIRDDAGFYRRYGVRIVGSNIPTANYLKVPELMKEFCKKLSTGEIEEIVKIHAEFEKIHPFSDGNGRVGRLLLNAMLLRSGMAPAIIEKKDKQIYYTYLNKAQRTEDSSLLQSFILDAIYSGYQILK